MSIMRHFKGGRILNGFQSVFNIIKALTTEIFPTLRLEKCLFTFATSMNTFKSKCMYQMNLFKFNMNGNLLALFHTAIRSSKDAGMFVTFKGYYKLGHVKSILFENGGIYDSFL